MSKKKPDYNCNITFHSAAVREAKREKETITRKLALEGDHIVFEDARYSDGRDKYSLGVKSRLSRPEIKERLADMFPESDGYVHHEKGGPIKGAFSVRLPRQSMG